jgi:hypothetical protein
MCGGAPMFQDKRRFVERLIDTYTDNIRATDLKSNVIGIMIIFSMSVLSIFRQDLPAWLPLYMILTLPMCSIFFLILSLIPRFSVAPGLPFYVKREVSPNDFDTIPEEENEVLNAYRNDCACLAKILYRKVLYFRIAIGFCFVYSILLFSLAITGALSRAH